MRSKLQNQFEERCVGFMLWFIRLKLFYLRTTISMYELCVNDTCYLDYNSCRTHENLNDNIKSTAELKLLCKLPHTLRSLNIYTCEETFILNLDITVRSYTTNDHSKQFILQNSICIWLRSVVRPSLITQHLET